MLVLSRKVGERVFVGEGAGRTVVTLLEVDRGKVRLGFEADRSIEINREEVALAIEARRKAGAGPGEGQKGGGDGQG